MAAASESDHRALGYTALTTVVLNPAVVIVPTPPFNALSSRRPRWKRLRLRTNYA